jgi:hypothetical protein
VSDHSLLRNHIRNRGIFNPIRIVDAIPRTSNDCYVAGGDTYGSGGCGVACNDLKWRVADATAVSDRYYTKRQDWWQSGQ